MLTIASPGQSTVTTLKVTGWNFSLMLHFQGMQVLVNINFQIADFGELGDGDNQYHHREHPQRNDKR